MITEVKGAAEGVVLAFVEEPGVGAGGCDEVRSVLGRGVQVVRLGPADVLQDHELALDRHGELLMAAPDSLGW